MQHSCRWCSWVHLAFQTHLCSLINADLAMCQVPSALPLLKQQLLAFSTEGKEVYLGNINPVRLGWQSLCVARMHSSTLTQFYHFWTGHLCCCLEYLILRRTDSLERVQCALLMIMRDRGWIIARDHCHGLCTELRTGLQKQCTDHQ